MLLVCGAFQVALVWNDKNQCLVVVVVVAVAMACRMGRVDHVVRGQGGMRCGKMDVCLGWDRSGWDGDGWG